MNDRQRLEAILDVVCRYLPPDGISREDAMNQIIALVDPMPPRKEWVGISDEEVRDLWHGLGGRDKINGYDFAQSISAKLKERNGI